MLEALSIRNLAVVAEADLEFSSGMTALTGETGAGKSILVDALGLVLGDRADNAMIRAGCERAEVTASFRIEGLPSAAAWLRHHDLLDESTGEHGECLLRRVLIRDGRSRAFVNGTPMPVGELASLGALLVDIHGQHAHQSLMRSAAQRDLLDAYAGHHNLVKDVRECALKLRAVNQELESTRHATRENDARLEFLNFQIQELTAAAPSRAEWQDLENEHRRLSNAESLSASAESLAALLFEEGGTEQKLSRATDILAELAAVDDALTPNLELLRSALIELQETGTTLRHYTETLDMDPGRLAEVEARLSTLHTLARKFHVKPDALEEKLGELEAERGGLRHADVRTEELTLEAVRLAEAYEGHAHKLAASRSRAGRRLGTAISDSMQGLGMAGGSFSVGLEPLPVEDAAPQGTERVVFQVTANPGQPEQPLARVASGGELSRISLAIQVAAAECSPIPSLIFDEVDVGIGGGTAEMVGRLLRRIASKRQVLCVTHLPQVASQAHHHLRVDKDSADETTRTRISTLDSAEKIAEIARMLGGVSITDQTLAHAREMLSLAAER